MAFSLSRRQAVQIGVLVAGGWAAGRLLQQAAPIGRNVSQSHAVVEIFNGGTAPATGPATASVHMAVFTDYRCPACRLAFPQMEAAVRADGDVRLIYKDWPIFGAASERAARVALAAAEQDIYPAVHRRLMTDPRLLTDSVLREIVTMSGGSWPQVEATLIDMAPILTERLRSNARQALAIGLSGTPGFLAGPMLAMGALDSAEFARLFAEARDAI